MKTKSIQLEVTAAGEVLFCGNPCAILRGDRGYHSIRLSLHRVVAVAFYGQAPSARHVCHHKDGNPRNNSADNLCWITQAENTRLHFKGRKRKLTGKQVTDILAMKPATPERLKDLADAFGVSYSAVRAIRSGVNWKNGYRPHNHAILTEAQIDRVRRWLPPVITATRVARQYRVSDQMILDIWHGRYPTET